MFGPLDATDMAEFGIVRTPLMTKAVLSPSHAGSGYHTSKFESGDSMPHISIKAGLDSKVIGHLYKDGTIKGTNGDEQNQGRSGALPWLLSKLTDE